MSIKNPKDFLIRAANEIERISQAIISENDNLSDDEIKNKLIDCVYSISSNTREYDSLKVI